MAISFQQQALVRKVIYIGLIVGLFTLSLLHRRLVVEPMGNYLLLREVSKGEVKLTDSAVRLALTGSRGIAVTFLWSTALEKQKKHEWNELDLLVASITKLQPHFITPWMFQSWNLAFNVAVECDRPRDKYFYISRGLEVLAEGERRNYKPPAPGNPDMRQYMGSFYQLKIGNSDEKHTMRCLLEMSCIDPLHRAPDRLSVPTERGNKVRLDQFKEFCIRYPRLVRRLHDQLKMTTPEAVVAFLGENKDVPSRFEPATGGPQQTDSVVKEELEQFPILPPGRANPKDRELSTTELVDVFFISRKWYKYSQEPLPAASPDPSVDPVPPNPLEKRLPRFIAAAIFRGYPARAQAYIAENLEAEGWFDADGWAVKNWFDVYRGPNDPEIRVGTDSRYHAEPSWNAAYQMYLDYGTQTGLYLPADLETELNRAAGPYRDAYKIAEKALGPDLRPDDPLYKSYRAHKRLISTSLYQTMTNYPVRFAEADAERSPEAVTARKLLYNARRYRQANDPEQAIPLYDKAWQLWANVLLSHLEFARTGSVQEDLYEMQIPYIFYVQTHRAEEFKRLLVGMTQLALWPHPPVDQLLKEAPSELLNILPIRSARGMMDNLFYYDGPDALGLKAALAGWPQGAVRGMHVIYPALVNFQLTSTLAVSAPRPNHWRAFVDQESINRVRDRLGLNRARKAKS